MNINGTKQRVLDAAEYLFARDGFHATSLRAITGRAKVNLASVNYHFGSKDALLEAVVERRLVPLNKARMEMLSAVIEDARKARRRPRTREILRAFIEPTIRFRESGQGARNFIMLIGRFFTEPNDAVKKAFLRFMTPVFKTMLDSLGEALPDVPPHLIMRRFHFAIGSIAHTMQICDEKSVPEGLRLMCGADTDSLIDELVGFVTAGMEKG